MSGEFCLWVHKFFATPALLFTNPMVLGVKMKSARASNRRCPDSFPSVKEAISYCGLCGDERSSADKVLRMPLSKQRNKHIQRTLIEAAKLATRYNHELAEVYEKERQRGNANRATLAVARKLVAYLLAVERRKKEFVPAEVFRATTAA